MWIANMSEEKNVNQESFQKEETPSECLERIDKNEFSIGKYRSTANSLNF